MRFNRTARLCLCMALCLSLTGCVSYNSLPITEENAEVSLPAAEVSFVAPIGDAALEYTEPVTLYLPSHDGISLTPVETTVSYTLVRPRAESLMRALLAQAGSKAYTALGGQVKLSLYGRTPVEVSRDVVTVNLSASALQLDRERLFLTCQAIANTLTQLEDIRYVNVLVVDKPVGLDVSNSLPMGAFRFNSAADLGAVYEQLLSRKVGIAESAEDKPFSAQVTLYYPLRDTDGVVSEVQTMSFENQYLADMVIAVLRRLAVGPQDTSIDAPALPLLADLLTSKPVMLSSRETGTNVITLDFAHNLDDMLEAHHITREQCVASLTLTLSTLFPNVSGIQMRVTSTPVEPYLQTEDEPDTQLADAQTTLRAECTARLLNACTLYFPDEDGALHPSVRQIPYYHVTNPRNLLQELAKGPQVSDSLPGLCPVMPADGIADKDLLGFALSDGTLVVNFASSFGAVCKGIEREEERPLAYALVNTLCTDEHVKSICFFQSGSQFETFAGEIYWAGLFYPLP